MNKLLVCAAVVLFLQATPAAAQRRGFWPGPYPQPYPYSVIVPFPILASTAPSYAPPPPAMDALPEPQKNRAVIKIIVPSTANDIWVDDVKMPSRLTSSRTFISPPLEPGHTYTYTVRAAWPSGFNMVAQDRTVVVRADQTTTVDFNLPPNQ